MPVRSALTGLPCFLRSLRQRLHSCMTLGLVAVLLFSGTACNALGLGGRDDNDDLTKLLLLSGIFLFASNPCNSIASPTVASASHGSAALSGRATLAGRILTRSGAPVVSALVVAQSSSVNHFSTLSSVNRNGSFYLSGLPTGAGYKIAVESLNTEFNGRIATHVDCFQTPSSFTDGWYSGSGGALVSSSGAGTSVNLSTANATVDVGTILLNQ